MKLKINSPNKKKKLYKDNYRRKTIQDALATLSIPTTYYLLMLHVLIK